MPEWAVVKKKKKKFIWHIWEYNARSKYPNYSKFTFVISKSETPSKENDNNILLQSFTKNNF